MTFAFHFSLILSLLFLSGIFSATETALFSLTNIEKRRLKERHPHLAKWVIAQLDHPRRALVAIIIGNLLVNILATAIVTLIALESWGPQGAGLAVAGFTILLIFFGEIIPKTLAVKNNEVFSMMIVIPLDLFARLIFPIQWVTRKITESLLSLLVREWKEKNDEISEEELKTLITIGEEEGVLDSQERQMIHKVFELGERPIKDIMKPRVDLAALDIEDSREEHVEMIQKYHYAYFPVYQETIDNVLGIIPVQDYLLHPDQTMRELMLQPLFVPETKRIDELLAEFRNKRANFAICVDEHGGTDGIVTLEDILEEVFGEFYDEYEKVENPIRPFGQGVFIVEAKIALADFNEYFGSNLEAEESSTLSGFILEHLGEVPKKGKVVTTEEFEMTIHAVLRQRRIRYILVKPLKL